MKCQINNPVIVTNVPTLLNNKYIRMWSHYIESPEGRYYMLNGKRIDAKEFESMYPTILLDVA